MRANLYLLLALIAWLPTIAVAQAPTFEVRGSHGLVNEPVLAVPDHADFGDGGGPGVGVAFGLAVNPAIDLTIGFSNHAFRCDADCSLRSAGFEAGARGDISLGGLLQPWVAGGVLFHRVHLRHDVPGDAPAWTAGNADPGAYVGGGIGVSMGSLEIAPGLRYHRYGVEVRDVDPQGVPGEPLARNVQFLVVELGFRFRP